MIFVERITIVFGDVTEHVRKVHVKPLVEKCLRASLPVELQEVLEKLFLVFYRIELRCRELRGIHGNIIAYSAGVAMGKRKNFLKLFA